VTEFRSKPALATDSGADSMDSEEPALFGFEDDGDEYESDLDAKSPDSFHGNSSAIFHA
jgi:hypothetical protein